MKKYLINFIKAACLLSLSFLFSGCLKDSITHTFTYSWYEPLFKTKAEVIADIKSSPPREIQNPGKIFIIGKYIFLNEISKGIHVLDNSDPSSPKNIAFVTIVGNVDIAVKGNTLYADLYNDLVTLDITNPLQVINTKIVENAFPGNNYYSYGYGDDSNKIIYDWKRHDTTIISEDNQPQQIWPGGVALSADDALALQNFNRSPVPTGIAGSMARFALVNNYLYTVGNSDLNIFDISTPENPSFIDKVNIGSWNIETIFPFKNKLFIGSQNGMYVYNIDNQAQPALDGKFGHVQSCDPVIADDNYAYITLSSGSKCQGFNNQLDILRLNDLTNPSLVKSYDLTSPHGLSKNGNLLFICDGTDGLKVYNASDVNNLKLIKHFPGMETFDVIANKNIALIIAKDGLYQYDYSNVNDIHLISKISIAK
ncbi:MAG TPA: hypothetical protein VGP55_16295 [Chitinophagaceae bacterium]|nr:hypothetical protein [Chitinophagaceae bacterium]